MAHDYRAALDKYRGVNVIGQTAYVSGHIGWRDGAPTVTGTLGADLDVEAGRIAARDAAPTALGTLEQALGDLTTIAAVARIFGTVRATAAFAQHPAVIDGASQLLLDVLGPDVGAHARSRSA
ncbi:RidA family protein [Nocardia abscessus]|uniref:RidA family protein n=1 Tax=Nocardia abscessus TaxID=120957 RepID=UPI00245442DF|nr:RidA family protein [Nocardia abscessus]